MLGLNMCRKKGQSFNQFWNKNNLAQIKFELYITGFMHYMEPRPGIGYVLLDNFFNVSWLETFLFQAE